MRTPGTPRAARVAGDPDDHDETISFQDERGRVPRCAGLRSYRAEVVGPAVWKALVDDGTLADCPAEPRPIVPTASSDVWEWRYATVTW